MYPLRRIMCSPAVVQVGFVLGVFILWNLVQRTGRVNALLLPPIGSVWTAVVKIIVSGAAVSALETTMGTVLVAFAGASLLGVAGGFVIGRSAYLLRVFDPMLSSIFAIPLTLFFPPLLLFFGIGPASKIAYGMTYAFFPITLNTLSGFAQVNRRLLLGASSMGASPWLLFRRVLLPGALPVILTGLRIGFFVCFAAVLGGETLSSVNGLGHEIASAAQLMDSAQMFAWVLIVISLSFALVALAGLAERRRGYRNRAGAQ